MPNYIDSFILPVPEAKLEDYRALAEKMGKLWKSCGALEYHEFVADDVKSGKLTSFPQSVQAEDGELVVVSYITYKTREHRDEVMAKVMGDPAMKEMNPKDMPFDAMRMFWGGFKNIVSA